MRPTVKGAMSTDAAERQQQTIVKAALELLEAGGPQALRVRDIAQAAGCTTMAVYSRFGGKDGVVDAIYIDGFRRFTEALEREAKRSLDDRAERLSTAYRRWAHANPGVYQVMFTEAVPGFVPSQEAMQVAHASFSVLLAAVEELQDDGRLRDGEPIEMAWALWGMSHGLVMLELAGIQPTAEPVAADGIYSSALAAVWRGFTA